MQKAQVYSFGDFRLDVGENILRRGDEKLRINRRTFQILQLLVENAGELISKQEFFEKVWADTFVAENSLTVTMNTLRKVLGDSRKDARFIENISRKGYRFIAPVEIILETEIGEISRVISPEIKENFDIETKVEKQSPNSFAEKFRRFFNGRKIYASLAIFGSILFCLSAWLLMQKNSVAAHSTLPAENTVARQNYLLARHHLEKRGYLDLPLAVKYFKQTVSLKPDCAEAYSGMATAFVLYGTYGVDSPKNSIPQARDAAEKALKLNADSDEALIAQAFIAYHYDYDWDKAGQLFNRALELAPKSFIAHHWHGEFLNVSGKTAEGAAEIETAVSLDPLSQTAYDDLALGYYLARDYEKAFFYAQKSLEIEKSFATAHYNMSEFYELQNKYDESVAEWLKAMSLEEMKPDDIAILETAYKTKGFHGFSQAKAAWLEKYRASEGYILATDIAKSYIGAGDSDKALTWLETAFDERASDLIFIVHSPAYDKLRGEPRFQEILRKMNVGKI